MNSYVVRVYRRNEAVPGDVAGLVEEPLTGRTTPFRNAEELWLIVGCAAAGGKDKCTSKRAATKVPAAKLRAERR